MQVKCNSKTIKKTKYQSFSFRDSLLNYCTYKSDMMQQRSRMAGRGNLLLALLKADFVS